MREQPKIEYVRQLYIYGSEVQAPARRAGGEKVALPKPKRRHVQKIYINPVALAGIVLAVTMLVLMGVSAFRLQAGWEAYNAASELLTEVKRENAALDHTFHTGFDPEDIRAKAEELGMVDKSEAPVMTLKIHVPQEDSQPTWLDDLKWFLKGLFAQE